MCTNYGNNQLQYTLNGSAVSEQEFLDSIQEYEQSDLSRSSYRTPAVFDSLAFRGNDFKPGRVPFRYRVGGKAPWGAPWFLPVTEAANLGGVFQEAAQSRGGSGVSVYWLGPSIPALFSTPNVVQPDFDAYDRPKQDQLNAMRYAQVIASLAPDACITGVELLPAGPVGNALREGCGSYFLAAHVYTEMDGGHLGPTSYNEEAAALDDYVYSNRVTLLASAGEVEGNRFYGNNAGASLNAIRVAGFDSLGLNLLRAASMPQVVNYDRLFLQEDPQILVEWRDTLTGKFYLDFVNQPASGPSSATATAYTAGMVARLLSDFPFYRWQPQLVKALLLTSSTLPNGAPDYRAMTRNNFSSYWMGPNGAHFIPASEPHQPEFIPVELPESVNPGERWRMALAWLTRGDFPLNNESLQQELELAVHLLDLRGDTLQTFTASKVGRGYQTLDFIVPEGTSRVDCSIRRTRNYGGKVLAGFNLHVDR